MGYREMGGAQGRDRGTGERDRGEKQGDKKQGRGTGSKAEIGTLGSNTGSGTQAAGHIVTQTRRDRGAQMLQQGCD